MLLIHAKLYTLGPQGVIEDGFIQWRDGKITAVGPMEARPNADEPAIDAQGGICVPGFVDAHTHLGMWENAMGSEGADANESTDPVTPHLRAIDGVNPQDAYFQEALSAGVTTVLTGPGSANPIAGQILAMKTMGGCADEMCIDAYAGMKFALGENPKRVYDKRKQTPVTRMATAAVIREQLYKAAAYLEKKQNGIVDGFDLKCEALLPLLQQKRKAYFHAHRADDIYTALRIAEEFKLDAVIVHGTDAAQLADELARRRVPVLTGPLLTDRSKPELAALSPTTAGALNRAGVKMAIITDHPVIPIGYLPLCAHLAASEGLDPMEALKAITVYPAAICGLSERVGSIEVGKDADIVLFGREAEGAFAKPSLVCCNGRLAKREGAAVDA